VTLVVRRLLAQRAMTLAMGGTTRGEGAVQDADRDRAHRAPRAPRAHQTPRTARRTLAQRLAALLRERLVQFAILGGGLFALAPKPRLPEVIEVSSARLAALRTAEATRPSATSERAAEVDQRAVEDEILYREGVRLGLDKNDGIVRQRVVQKVLFLAEEMGGASRPIEEPALQAFFEENKGRWAKLEQHRFAQVYRHDRAALAAWMEGGQAGEPPAGEPSPVGPEIDGDQAFVARTLGDSFARELAEAPVGRWSGPLASAFGWHLVRVIERRPARPARLDEVRPAVVEAYSLHRRQEATAAFLESAYRRYRVSIDGKPLEGFTPTRRIAFRSVSSGED
jgi:hypothetical protein